MKAVGALLMSGLLGLASALASTDTITWGGDNTRAGYQTNHNMDPAVVGSDQFGQLFKTALPGVYNGAAEQIFSQPLVYTPSGGTKQFVYFATTQNNVYKLDAKTGQIVASRNLHIPFLTADLSGCVDINPTVGVTATGVIDPATDTLYLTAKTYVDQSFGTGPQGRPAGRYYIHALDVNDLSERPNFPVDLEGTVARNSPIRVFGGGIHHQRPGLLHTGQYIYAGFASHCVQYNFTGWIIGWDKTTGKIVERWATEGEGVPANIKGGGIWMSGGGLASDDAGSIFFATGNGYASQLSNVPVKGFNPPTSLEEAAVHMTINADGSLDLVDFFMPWEKQALDGADKDLGTSPLEILPSQFACGEYKRIGVVTGKSGKTYWLNLDNLGGYRNRGGIDDDVIQVYPHPNSVYAGAGVYPLEGGYIYINVIQYPTQVFKFACNSGVPSFIPMAKSPANNAYILGVSHGTTTSLNGQEGTGLLWVTDVQGLNLKIYNAVPKDGLLVMINSFNIPGTTKFTRPVFGDGIVYVGTTQGFVYGFGSPVNSPLNCTSPVDFGGVNIRNSSSTKPVSCTANIALTVTGVALDNSKDYTISAAPQLPLELTKGQSFTISAKFNPMSVGFLSDDILVNTTNKVIGYSASSHARLTGTGQSSGPLLSLSPNTITFAGVVTGQDPRGVSESLIVSNRGNTQMTVNAVLYSADSSSGPFQPWSGQGDLVVGKFTLQNIPATVAANAGVTVKAIFDSSTSGSFAGFVKFVTDGGNSTVSIAASSGPAAVALLEFQTPDGQDWVRYQPGTPFTFGNVTENTSNSLKFRVTNAAPAGGVKLSLTVSKPPFGVDSIIRAANQVDLAEGSSFAPGESGTAVLTCTAPKSQWNIDPYNGTAQWTMNTNDPNSGKQFIQFFCNAVAEQAPPLLPNGQGQYRYAGCFKDNTPGRQLPKQVIATDTLTNAQCIAACAQGNYVFCGTQYHRECWAGNAIPLQKVDDTNCNFYCAGAINQVCGGNGVGDQNGGTFMSLFADSLQWDGNYTKPPVGGPFVNPGVSGYSSVGCYTEATNGRALPNGLATDKKTVATCVNACKGKAYKYAGVEYGGECWCGNAFGVGSVAAPVADCRMTCNDNSTEYCGGPSRLNVYQLDAAVSSSSTAAPVTSMSTVSTPGTSASTSATTTTATDSTTSAPASTTTRAIDLTISDPAWTTTSAIDLTISDPPSTTTSAIDSTISDPTSTTTTTTSSTSTAPASTPTPTGPAIKDAVGKYRFQGCWTEATTGRALTGKTYANDLMTLESCAKFCDAFTYFGVEYGRECYCGNDLKAGSVKAANQKDCSFTCPGDKSEYCGAGVRLQLYMLGDTTTTTTTTTVATSTTAPTTTSSSTAPLVESLSSTSSTTVTPSTSSSQPPDTSNPSPSPTSTSSTSTLPTSASTTPTATPTLTSSSTIPASTSTSPTSISTDLVSSTTSTDAVTTSSTQPTSSTTVVSSTETTTSSASATPTGPIVWPVNANFTFYSCVSEPSSGRLMDAQVLNDGKNMTIDLCLQKCYNYLWAGVEYGRECWCGNKLNLAGNKAVTPGKNLTKTECNMLCPGDKNVYCGAGTRLSLYSNNATTT